MQQFQSTFELQLSHTGELFATAAAVSQQLLSDGIWHWVSVLTSSDDNTAARVTKNKALLDAQTT
jgi:hypothetical protein